MATFKAEVYIHQKKQDGTFNIKIRVIHNQKKKYLSTVWFVTTKDLSRTKSKSTFKIKNQRYIDLTNELIQSYRKICDDIGQPLKTMSVEEVVNIITKRSSSNTDIDFSAFSYSVVNKLLQQGRKSTAKNYEHALRYLHRFAGKNTIMSSEIRVLFLNEWIEWMQEHSNMGANTILKVVAIIRAIHNLAKKKFNDEDAGIVRIQNSPFSRIELPLVTATRKRALSADKIKAIYELPYSEKTPKNGKNRFNIAKDVFILSFVLVGMNAADIFNCTNYEDGRITYERAKTRARRLDKALMSIKVEPEFQWLIDKYRDPLGDRVFCFSNMYSSKEVFTYILNHGLKIIGKMLDIEDLEFYSARHSWATIATNDVGIDKYTVHESLNHVDPSMKVTDVYIKKDWKNIDKANRKVIDFVFGNKKEGL